MRKTIEETIRFLEIVKSGVIKKSGLVHIKKALESSLNMKVFTNSLDEIYSINDANEMRSLIKGGKLRKGSYNPIYRVWKLRHAPFPHEVTGILKSHTIIKIIGDTVEFSIPSFATTRTSTKGNYNFGPIHERRKSILKATVYFAWSDIMKRIRELYKRFIEIA